MAYAAVISLKLTIHRHENQEILKSAYKEVRSLQEILQGLQSRISDSSISKSRISISETAVNALNREIREAANKLEDAVESRSVSKSGETSPSRDEELAFMQQEINYFKERVKQIKDYYNCIIKELESTSRLPEADDVVVDGGGTYMSSTNMVGLSDEFDKLKDWICEENVCPGYACYAVISIVGMAGIGKTTLARNIFDESSIRDGFAHSAFVTVGPKYQLKEIMVAILEQITISSTKRKNLEAFREYISGKFLIVLDDVWDKKILDSVCRHLPGSKGSRVLVTTRVREIAQFISIVHQMRFLNKEESLYLLRENVFGRHDRSFPDKKAAEKIVENCEGLPLAIIAVAGLLSKAEKTPDYWKKVAAKGSLIFREVGDDMVKVLVSSYNYLPEHLKACFLYMGVFPPKCKIPASKLVNLWKAERFLEPNWKQDFEDFARRCLEDLALKSDLILVRQQRSNTSEIKTCSLHPVYWYLCEIEATKERFLHVLKSCVDSSTQGVETQRRLCIHNIVLFGMEDVRDSIKSNNFSVARSLLCTGPYHQYPLPRICFGSRLLKVVDVLTIRFYIFPIEVVELVQLRFLALTYSGKIPASIAKLQKLEYLIVHQHLSDKQHLGANDQHVSVISFKARTHLPIEIWNMQQLRCLQVMGSDLIIPHDGDCGALLSNLLMISYMSADSCTKEILKRTRNLKKLGIQIELPPAIGADHHPFHCFNHLAEHLHQLKSLKCVVVNPSPTFQVVSFPISSSTTLFPSSLTKLSLSGLGYPWKYTRVIAQLPNLQSLKLLCYAFQGPTWSINGFQKLRFLLIEDTDLESLKFRSYLISLRQVIIRHCYNLKKITNDFIFEYPVKYELVDCPAVVFAKDTQENIAKNNYIQLCVQSSWDDQKKAKSRLLP